MISVLPRHEKSYPCMSSTTSIQSQESTLIKHYCFKLNTSLQLDHECAPMRARIPKLKNAIFQTHKRSQSHFQKYWGSRFWLRSFVLKKVSTHEVTKPHSNTKKVPTSKKHYLFHIEHSNETWPWVRAWASARPKIWTRHLSTSQKKLKPFSKNLRVSVLAKELCFKERIHTLAQKTLQCQEST